MKPIPSLRPIEKNVVLIGAGNAHLVFLKRWGMRPMPGVAVTLVNEFSAVRYSAMVPAHVAGDYSTDEISIDLVRLCASVGVRFVRGLVTRIDRPGRRVEIAGRVPVAYDLLSLGLGSVPACPAGTPPSDFSFSMRPLGRLIERVAELENRLKTSPRTFHLVVVGGGASGCELALAMHRRLGALPGFRMTLLHAHPRLLPQFPAGAGEAFRAALEGREVTVRVGVRVTGTGPGVLILESAERLPCAGVLWATDATPPRVLGGSGLTLDPDGFLHVRETLQAEADPTVFGTGDCVTFRAYPNLPKNGVYAVREGAILFENVAAVVQEKPLRPFRPQRYYLALLNTGDGDALLSYGPVTWKSPWARRLKDRIDRAWMEKFTPPPMAAGLVDGTSEPPTMRCGGCGSKVAGDVLSAVLGRLAVGTDPRILLGCRNGEDATVHRLRPELFGPDPGKLVEVQTVDSFRAFIDDPYLFGRVAAVHAVSDLHAMNARPFSALAIATLPFARGPIQEAQLYEMLAGAVESFRKLGVVLTGGHTTEGSELALGFAVTGYGEEDRLFRKSGLKAGDRLVVTKPLGSGALLAAWMRGACQAAWLERLTQGMLQPNAQAAGIFDHAGVVACTDVTGFGLAGHLLEMLDASRLSARLDVEAVPLYPGFEEVVGAGIVSTLQRDNGRAGGRVHGPGAAPEWLFDPQTSGGLLAGVRPGAVADVLARLREADCVEAAVIGEVIPLDEHLGPTIFLGAGSLQAKLEK